MLQRTSESGPSIMLGMGRRWRRVNRCLRFKSDATDVGTDDASTTQPDDHQRTAELGVVCSRSPGSGLEAAAEQQDSRDCSI